MQILGYGDDMKSFSDAIKRATKTLNALNVDIFSHISKTMLGTANGVPDDYMLTRFGAYLVTMNADPRKPQVAKAQAYFIAMTRQFEMWLEQPDDFARVLSLFNDGIQGFQFCPCLFDVEVPLNTFELLIARRRPRLHRRSQLVDRSKTTMLDTLHRQRTQIVLRHIQPTPMLRSRNNLQSPHQRPSHLRLKRLIKRTQRMSVQIITHQNNLLRIRKINFQMTV